MATGQAQMCSLKVSVGNQWLLMDPQTGALMIIINETGPDLCDPERPCSSTPLIPE